MVKTAKCHQNVHTPNTHAVDHSCRTVQYPRSTALQHCSSLHLQLDLSNWLLDLAPGSGSWYWVLAPGTGYWLLVLDTGYWILDTGYWIPGYWILDTGYWIPGCDIQPLGSPWSTSNRLLTALLSPRRGVR